MESRFKNSDLSSHALSQVFDSHPGKFRSIHFTLHARFSTQNTQFMLIHFQYVRNKKQVIFTIDI